RDYSGRFPQAELFYLIGADPVSQLPKWREADELARLVEFVVIPRPVESTTGVRPIPSGEQFKLPPPFRGRKPVGFPLGGQSSQIRERVKAGLSIEHLTPAPVEEAIRNNRIYL